MIQATLAHMRNSSNFFKTSDIIKILDGRKNEEIGFFVPLAFKEEFQAFMETVEKKKKAKLLDRVAKAQKNDPIEEGSSSDGIR